MNTTFLKRYRKSTNPEQTHFCPGCGHGNLLKFVDLALIELSCAEQTVWVSPVGCGGLTDAYLSISHVLAPHGRASAVATAVKRILPDKMVIVSQGDGDFASIGLAESLIAANRGENITVFVVNNVNFGMTGGQMSSTSLIGQQTPTSVEGRALADHGPPMKICEILQSLDGPSFIARVAFGNVRQCFEARKIIARAIDNQYKGRGYSFVEILSPCPVNWHMTPIEARNYVANVMPKVFPTGIFRDTSKAEWITARSRVTPFNQSTAIAAIASIVKPQKPVSNISKPSSDIAQVNLCDDACARTDDLQLDDARFCDRRVCNVRRALSAKRRRQCDGKLGTSHEKDDDLTQDVLSISILGLGGQGVMMIGKILARLCVLSHFYVTWIPSYGPEKRGGRAHCFVKMGCRPIVSPIVENPDCVLVLSATPFDALEKCVTQGGMIMYHEDLTIQMPQRHRHDVIYHPLNVTSVNERHVNMIFLATLLRQTHLADDPRALIDAIASLGIKVDDLEGAFMAGWDNRL